MAVEERVAEALATDVVVVVEIEVAEALADDVNKGPIN